MQSGDWSSDVCSSDLNHFSPEWQEEYARYCKEHSLMAGNESAAEFVHYKDEQLEAAMENGDA